MSNCKIRRAFALCGLLLLISACSARDAALPATPASASPAAPLTSTPTAFPPAPTANRPAPTLTLSPKAPTRTPTPSPAPTYTLAPTATGLGAGDNLAMLGTALPEPAGPITAASLPRLAQVGVWGKGTIRGAAFNPDGSSFAVGSAFGVAVYTMYALDQPPRWLSFDQPFLFASMAYSTDGRMLILEADDQAGRAFDLAAGQFVRPIPKLEWIEAMSPARTIGWSDQSFVVTSPDGRRGFSGGFTYVSLEDSQAASIFEESESAAIAEIYDAVSGETLDDLSAGLPYVHYFDRTDHEGCDLNVFSPCGNALMAVPTSPYQAAFSSDSKTLAVLYRAAELVYPRRFSTLRLYRAEDGKLLQIIGSFEQPVQDFAFSPDSRSLLVAYTGGLVELLDIESQQPLYRSPDFTQNLWSIELTPDGQFVVLQYAETVQVRFSRDGALLASFPATAYALSSAGDRLAIGNSGGWIDVYPLPGGAAIHLEGHRDLVYALAFSPDGRYLASSGRDCATKYWDVAEKRVLHGFENVTVTPYEDYGVNSSRIFVYSLGFVPQSNQLLGFGSWGTVASWDAATGAAQFIVPSSPLDFYQGMVTIKPHFPTGFGLDAAGNRFSIDDTLYDLTSGALIGPATPQPGAPEDCLSNGAISPDGTLLLTLGWNDRYGQVCFLEAGSRQMVGFTEVMPEANADYVGMLWPAFSPDGGRMYAPTHDGVVFVYQVFGK